MKTIDSFKTVRPGMMRPSWIAWQGGWRPCNTPQACQPRKLDAAGNDWLWQNSRTLVTILLSSKACKWKMLEVLEKTQKPRNDWKFVDHQDGKREPTSDLLWTTSDMSVLLFFGAKPKGSKNPNGAQTPISFALATATIEMAATLRSSWPFLSCQWSQDITGNSCEGRNPACIAYRKYLSLCIYAYHICAV